MFDIAVGLYACSDASLSDANKIRLMACEMEREIDALRAERDSLQVAADAQSEKRAELQRELGDLRGAIVSAVGQLDAEASKRGEADCSADAHFREALRTIARTLPPVAVRFSRGAVWGELREMDVLHENNEALRAENAELRERLMALVNHLNDTIVWTSKQVPSTADEAIGDAERILFCQELLGHEALAAAERKEGT